MCLFGLRKYVRACNWKKVLSPLVSKIVFNINYMPIDIYVTPCDWEALTCVHTAL